MVKTLTVRVRIFCSSTLKTIWVIGAGNVVAHLSA
jgi:hypothetical protein